MGRKKKAMGVILSLLVLFSAISFYFMGFFQKPAEYSVELSDSLKDVSPILIGASVNSKSLKGDIKYRELFLKHFSSMVAESQMKMKYFLPNKGDFHFTDQDYLVDFAEQNSLAMHGHTLIWHLSNPSWLENFDGTDAEFEEIIHTYITTVVSRYKGRIQTWDVVNEAVIGSRYRDTIFLQRLGEGYIPKLFQWAHEADPDAKLYYNDYDIITRPEKRDFILQELTTMINAGVPIHGLGIQSHLKLNSPSLEMMNESLNKCAQLGIDLRISELDITVNDDKRHYIFTSESAESQKQRYNDLVSIFLQYNCIKDITLWGIYDGLSWKSTFVQPDYPLLFDKNYMPKPAAEGFLLALQGKEIN